MPMNNPKVTVFIPVYNRQHYIGPAVDSVLAQTYGNFEVLIVDDGSTDGTLAKLAEYRDPRLRVERNPHNMGIPATRNRGLELARGEYIALLDSDDLCYPDRLARQVEFLDRHPDIVQIGSACNFMDADGHPLKRVRRQPLDPDDVAASLLFYCALTNRTIMARTAILKEYGYSLDFRRCQDYELHQRLSRKHRMANMGDILVCGREHDGRITRNTDDLGRDRKQAIYRRGIEELGMEVSDEDLARHYALTRVKTLGAQFDNAYLDWAEQWLLRLDAANRRVGRFASDAFARTVGVCWLDLCWKARRRGGLHAYRRALHSPLSRRLPGAIGWRSAFDELNQRWCTPNRPRPPLNH